MTDKSFRASDAGYHGRHARRTLRRAERIAENIETAGTVLDVGCNQGITSRYLLDVGKASAVTGVELYRSTVEPALLSHPNFELVEGNIVELELTKDYDYIIYGAVHHHVLQHNGISVALETLRKLAARCKRSIFFETGQLSEGGRWAWQRELSRYFRSDEEHFFYLLRSIEEFIEGFEVVGMFPIHGIRRAYLRIDISAHAAHVGLSSNRPRWKGELDGPFGRHFGSDGPSLQKIDCDRGSESPNYFWLSPAAGPERKFLKQYRHHPQSAQLEWIIGRQVMQGWAVRPESFLESDRTIVLPYLENTASVPDFRFASKERREKLAADVIRIFDDAHSCNVELPPDKLMSSKNRARLIDIVDLNANNLLVVTKQGAASIRVIDFEKHGENNADRNRLHLGRMLLSLRVRRIYAIACIFSGVLGIGLQLVRATTYPLQKRIANRQPSLWSLVQVAVRSATGRLIGRLLAMFGLN